MIQSGKAINGNLNIESGLIWGIIFREKGMLN